MEFTLNQVIAIGSALVALTGAFFAVRSMLKDHHNKSMAEILQVKYNSGVVREWLDKEGEMKINMLYDLHNVKDPDGVPVWYVRTSLEKVILDMSSTITQLAATVQESNIINGQILSKIEGIER